jgi:hypothetical protein
MFVRGELLSASVAWTVVNPKCIDPAGEGKTQQEQVGTAYVQRRRVFLSGW